MNETMTDAGPAARPPFRRRLWHPGILLAILDFLGLCIAGYLSYVELRGEVPTCAVIKGCETVANSEFSRIAGIPVAVFGVILSIALLSLALAWWLALTMERPPVRLAAASGGILLAHYALSMVGVIFEAYFTYLELFVIGAVCMWCALYAVSLLLRFVISLAVWLRRDRYEAAGEG